MVVLTHHHLPTSHLWSSDQSPSRLLLSLVRHTGHEAHHVPATSEVLLDAREKHRETPRTCALIWNGNPKLDWELPLQGQYQSSWRDHCQQMSTGIGSRWKKSGSKSIPSDLTVDPAPITAGPGQSGMPTQPSLSWLKCVKITSYLSRTVERYLRYPGLPFIIFIHRYPVYP